MHRLLIFILFLIVYGSLYPFKFSGHAPDITEFFHWLTNLNLQTTRGDIIANIILFMPYGFVARLCLNGYRRRIRAAAYLLLLAALVAFTLQYLQFYLPARVPDAADALFNLLGVILGLVLSHFLIQYSQNHIPNHLNHRNSWSQVSIPLLLALLWVCWRWFPFIPLAATDSIIESLNPIIHRPELDFFLILRDGIGWLVFFYLLSQPPFDKQPRFRVLKIAFSILAIELFIMNNQISVNDLLAMLLAFALYASLDFTSIASSLGWGLVVAMILTWMAPLADNVTTSAMNWVPFRSYLKGNPWLATESILLKLYLIGAMILHLKTQWLNYKLASIACFMLVFSLTMLQLILDSYRPDITDSIVVLFLGWGMFQIDKQASDERMMAMKS